MIAKPTEAQIKFWEFRLSEWGLSERQLENQWRFGRQQHRMELPGMFIDTTEPFEFSKGLRQPRSRKSLAHGMDPAIRGVAADEIDGKHHRLPGRRLQPSVCESRPHRSGSVQQFVAGSLNKRLVLREAGAR